MTTINIFIWAISSIAVSVLCFILAWVAFKSHERQVDATLAENFRHWTETGEHVKFEEQWTTKLHLALILFIIGVFSVLLFMPLWYDAVVHSYEYVYNWWVLRL